MIVFFCGTPGSGKSYDAVVKIIDNLRSGRVVCTNIDGMELQECQEYIKNILGWNDSTLKRQLRILTKDEVMRFWKTEEFTKTVFADGGSDFPDVTTTTQELICPHGSMIVIDEVHKFYNARDWQASASRELGDWASTHRHFGYDLVLITQSIEKVDKQVRTLTEWTYFYRKVNFLGSMVSKKYMKYSYSGDDHDGKALAKSVETYKADVFPCYKSYAAADAKEVGFMSHINILKHPIFFAIPILLCFVVYMFFEKSSFASGDIFGTSKVQHRFDTKKMLPVAPGALPVPLKTVAPVLASYSAVRVPLPVVALNAPAVPAAYVQYKLDGYIKDGSTWIISINGMSVKLPSSHVQKYSNGTGYALAEVDYFGPSSTKNVVPSLPAI